MDPRNKPVGSDMNQGGGVPPPKGYELSGKIMLIAIVGLLTATLLILLLHLYLRWRFLRRIAAARRRLHSHVVFAGEAIDALRPADRGLAPDILESLPVLVFSAAAGGEGDGEEVVECAVCMNEFEEGEKVRSLPPCGHRFHVECIDMWFHSHATCPLCRATVEAASPQVHIYHRRGASTAVESSGGGGGGTGSFTLRSVLQMPSGGDRIFVGYFGRSGAEDRGTGEVGRGVQGIGGRDRVRIRVGNARGAGYKVARKPHATAYEASKQGAAALWRREFGDGTGSRAGGRGGAVSSAATATATATTTFTDGGGTLV